MNEFQHAASGIRGFIQATPFLRQICNWQIDISLRIRLHVCYIACIFLIIASILNYDFPHCLFAKNVMFHHNELCVYDKFRHSLFSCCFLKFVFRWSSPTQIIWYFWGLLQNKVLCLSILYSIPFEYLCVSVLTNIGYNSVKKTN